MYTCMWEIAYKACRAGRLVILPQILQTNKMNVKGKI